jgi:hypothetical protein
VSTRVDGYTDDRGANVAATCSVAVEMPEGD